MSNEIIKWSGAGPVAPDTANHETIDQTITRWMGGTVILAPPPRQVPRRRPEVITAPPVGFVLTRWCAKGDIPYFVSYTQNENGIYVFDGSWWAEDRHAPQYAEAGMYPLPPDFRTGQEQCPCGKWTPANERGAIWCPCCESWIGWCCTTQTGYFHCRKSCKNESYLGRTGTKERFGIVPKLY